MMKDLKSGIEHIKQAKAHMLQATWIMSDCISKLRELEEENAGLRAKLEAFIQSDDSYMKLPLDADGVPIRIGDTVYTRDAEEYIVRGIYALADGYSISVVPLGRTCFLPMKPEGLTHRTTDSADSWEKLEEDAKKNACNYALSSRDEDGLTTCDGCPFYESKSCHAEMTLDMLKRAKKLAGIEEEAQR